MVTQRIRIRTWRTSLWLSFPHQFHPHQYVFVHIFNFVSISDALVQVLVPVQQVNGEQRIFSNIVIRPAIPEIIGRCRSPAGLKARLMELANPGVVPSNSLSRPRFTGATIRDVAHSIHNYLRDAVTANNGARLIPASLHVAV